MAFGTAIAVARRVPGCPRQSANAGTERGQPGTFAATRTVSLRLGTFDRWNAAHGSRRTDRRRERGLLQAGATLPRTTDRTTLLDYLQKPRADRRYGCLYQPLR